MLFGIQQDLESQILIQFSDQPELSHYFIDFAYSLLKHARGGIITGIGSLALLWTMFTLLVTLENNCNEVWNVHKSRRLKQQIIHYIALILLGPLLLVLASITLVFLTAKFTFFSEYIGLIIPTLSTWGLFFFVYWYMPNRRVPAFSAMIAAVIAGSLYQVLHWAFINFQLGISSYGAIYGSFAALPLFLIWIQFSWVVLLMGVIISKEISPS